MLIVLAIFLAGNITEEPSQVRLPFQGLKSFLEQEPAQKVSSITNSILALVNVIGDAYARCSICGIDIVEGEIIHGA